MRKHLELFYCIITAVAVFSLYTSCNKDGVGIFYSIEKETPTVNNNLPDDSTISGFAQGNNTFYVGAGKIFSVSVSEFEPGNTIWSELTAPAASTEDDVYQALDVAYFDGNLYACYAPVAGSSNNPGYAAYVRNGSDWMAISQDGGVGLMTAGDYLFLIVDDTADSSPKYDLYVSDDGTVFSLVLDDHPFPADMAYDEENDTYWLISGSSLLSATGTELTAGTDFTEPASYPATTGFTGIHYSQAISCLFLSTREGTVYESPDGSWNGAPVQNLGENLGDFTDYYTDYSVDVTRAVVLLGSKGGYYEKEFSMDNSTNPVTVTAVTDFQAPELSTNENYLSLELSTCVVRGFYAYPDTGSLQFDSVVFAMTAGYGLWSNILDTESDTREWNRE